VRSIAALSPTEISSKVRLVAAGACIGGLLGLIAQGRYQPFA
jgi:hypothetical protein